MAGIGHNSGHRLGQGWQRYCWTRARKELLGKRLPIEVVRTRIRRARELGLAYPQYASILLGTGRDIVGFLFTVDGLQLRLRRRLDVPDHVQEKLHSVQRCRFISFVPSGEAVEDFRHELSEVMGVGFDHASAEPEGVLDWPKARDVVKSALGPLKLPSRAVVLIGTRDQEEQLVQAGKLARFIASEHYFSNEIQ